MLHSLNFDKCRKENFNNLTYTVFLNYDKINYVCENVFAIESNINYDTKYFTNRTTL